MRGHGETPAGKEKELPKEHTECTEGEAKRNLRAARWIGRCLIAACLGLAGGGARADVNAWDLPAGATADAAGREGWKPAAKESRFAGGVAVENETLTVVIARGSAGPTIRSKSTNVRLDLSVLAANGANGAVLQAHVKDGDLTETVVEMAAGTATVNLTLRAGSAHVELTPGKDAGKLEVRSVARYALAPSTTAEDKLYDAVKHKSQTVPVPARPVLLELLEGRQAILALLWGGTKGAAKEKEAAKKDDEGEMRTVELTATGEGASRAFRSARIDFAGKPVHVGLLQGSNVWQDVDIRKMPGAKTQRLDWKRPFDAAWRVVFTVEGYDKQELAAFLKEAAGLGLSQDKENDWRATYLSIDMPRADTDPLPVESFYFRPAGTDGAVPLMNPANPEGDGRLWPCVFRGPDSLLTPVAEWPCYPDPTKDRLPAAQEKRTQEGKPPLYPIHVYGAMIVYPLDRTDKTPIDKFTVVDLMRQALGTGPCKLDWLDNCR